MVLDDVRVHSRSLSVCACACENIESEGKKRKEEGWNAGKERIRKKEKRDSLSKRVRFRGYGMCCVSAPCFVFLGEAGRAFCLKKNRSPRAPRGARGVPARERGSLLFLPFDTTSCHGCLLVLFVFRTPPRVAAAETWRASKMNNDCTFHCCLSLHRRPCRPCCRCRP